MILTFLAKGIFIGFSIAVPVGPIALLSISRTLEKGRLTGFVTGMGAATADGTYGLIAGFGLTAISDTLTTHAFWIRLIGGLFLLYLGLRIILSKKAKKKATAKESSLIGNYVSTVFLTLSNPMTILSFMAIFAGFGIGTSGDSYTSSSLFVLGVFLGSALWWLILTAITDFLKHRMTIKHIRWINRGSGLLIIGFGVSAIATLV